ncbi:D-alanyl-D-alanine carboxypeptidase [Streptomyces sp. V3I8]|uniref:serine hydrolase domain-containing protein n=1 Tax=Streptomyces sp. V3I8 TaxID=3042279 RepID=UPI0027889755|nr:serine hydrolase domain-containing protein [Streptomyces sp. V3I8]MDQ1035869.1 D-alanyl-D-alanine carboxypeptidase [Streptomyces sp. V3I8]
MHVRTRTACAAAMVLGLTALPLAGTALAAPSSPTAAVRETTAPARVDPDTARALRAAIGGLPDDDATAALVRVSGTDGTWRGSAGVRDLPSGREAVENGRFRAGSTTKVVTAAVVLQLAAEGRVDLDGHLQTYLPGLLPEAFEPITVRQLLTFTSGLQPGSSLGDVAGEGYERRYETLTPEEVVAASAAKGPASAPGERQTYSNIDYTVLGLLVEEVTKDSYEHQAALRVLRPAGMRHTSFPGGPDPRVHGPHNRGYQKLADGRLVDATEWNMSDRWAAGDMISTTADLERLLYALFRGRLVPRPLLEREMFTLPDVPGATMSAGLQRFDLGDGRILWLKSGARPGYGTLVAATRDLSRTLVYSVNATDAKGEDMNPVAERIVRAAFDAGQVSGGRPPVPR